MSKNNSKFRKTISTKKDIQISLGKNLVVFRYGALKDKKMAKGYCLNHKCFISKFDLKEKHCNNRHCKHFCKNVELFC